MSLLQALLNPSYNSPSGDFHGYKRDLDGTPKELYVCRHCGKDVPHKYEIIDKVNKKTGEKEEVELVDRSHRIDCEIPVRGKFSKNKETKELEPVTRYVVYHKECYIKALENEL